MVALLQAGDRRVGVRGVAPAGFYPGNAGGKVGFKKQAAEGNAEHGGGCLYDCSLVRSRIDRIQNNGVAGRECATGLIGQRLFGLFSKR